MKKYSVDGLIRWLEAQRKTKPYPGTIPENLLQNIIKRCEVK